MPLRHRQDGFTIRDLIVEVIQKRRGYFDAKVQKKVDGLGHDLATDPSELEPEYRPDFHMRGGCTILIDGESGMVRYVIAKDVLSERRLDRHRKYISGDDTSRARGDATRRHRESSSLEPFAAMHRGF